MTAYRAQAHLDASLDDVWALVGNPATYPLGAGYWRLQARSGSNW